MTITKPKTVLIDSLQQAVDHLKQANEIPSQTMVDIQLERSKDKQHGDYATNLALMLAKSCRCNPRELAQKIIAALPDNDAVARTELAGPGFINFHLSKQAFYAVIPAILEQKEQFGCSTQGKKQKVHMEFVSANPTGPLHVGHGRGAAFGASLTALLRATGYDVVAEYYVNDAGRQMDILAVSLWIRYLQLTDVNIPMPSKGYVGDYVSDLAKQLHTQYDQQFIHEQQKILNGLPKDGPDEEDKEVYMDALIARAKQLLAENDYPIIHQFGLNIILEGIRKDLSDFGVEYQNWFSENSLYQADEGESRVVHLLKQLEKSHYTYEREGALWFNASALGDEKDRVLVRANGQYTYFAADIAYHLDKLERGFEHLIDIWGADHHGYIPRVKAAMQALAQAEDKLDVLLVQFAILYRGKERLSMTTRGGVFVTLRDLYQEVGVDATRFFYISRKASQHLDFDLELAKSQSMDNPVYYIQYAHARICSVEQQLSERGYVWEKPKGLTGLEQLNTEQECDLIRQLSRYPEVISSAAAAYEPHQIAHYLRELANYFHVYYNAHQFIVDEQVLRNARLCLITAVGQVLRNGLSLLGVSAPTKM